MMIPVPQKREPEREESGQGSNAYVNLKALFGICASVEACNFYLESVETCLENGYITESERDELRGIGRAKRIDLAHPPAKVIQANGPGVYAYCPEIGEREPENAQIHATEHYGGHYGLYTTLDLKGRGIRLVRDAPNGHPTGTKEYEVTDRAFGKLKERYIISLKEIYR